jgi:hypothetical protein
VNRTQQKNVTNQTIHRGLLHAQLQTHDWRRLCGEIARLGRTQRRQFAGWVGGLLFPASLQRNINCDPFHDFYAGHFRLKPETRPLAMGCRWS